MSLGSSDIRSLSSVEANLNYLIPIAEKPFRYTYEPPPGMPVDNASYAPHRTRIHDARPVAARVSLDQEGFALIDHRSSVVNFYDEDEVRNVYYPEAEALLLKATGATKVRVFDHIVRRRPEDRPPLELGRPSSSAVRGPVGRVHNDFTDRSGPTRLRLELGAEAERWLERRFAIVNVWRAIRAPILDAPLAVCDASSVEFDDLIASDLIYRHRTGETYQVRHNPRHRWFYISALKADEALLLKTYDSAEDGRARFAVHSAFEDPTAPTDAPPRESIEVRAFVFYPD